MDMYTAAYRVVSLSDEMWTRSRLGSAFLFLERADSSSPAPKPEVPCPGYERRERGQCVRVRPRGAERVFCARKSLSERCAYATESRAWTTTTGRRRATVDLAILRRDRYRSSPRLRFVASGPPRAPRSTAIDLSPSESECRIVVVVRRRDAPRSFCGSGNCQAEIAECHQAASIDLLSLFLFFLLVNFDCLTRERRFSSFFYSLEFLRTIMNAKINRFVSFPAIFTMLESRRITGEW